MSEPKVQDAYETAEQVALKIHSADRVLKAIDMLIVDNVTPETTLGQLKDLLEIVAQLVDATATYVREAYDAAGEVSFALSGAH